MANEEAVRAFVAALGDIVNPTPEQMADAIKVVAALGYKPEIVGHEFNDDGSMSIILDFEPTTTEAAA